MKSHTLILSARQTPIRLRPAWRIALICCALVGVSFHPARADDMQISVGITPICPYGLAGCWPAAADALLQLDGVKSVADEPDAYNCTAFVRTKGEAIPDPEKWRARFSQLVGKQYVFRGVELTIEGEVEVKDERLFLKSKPLKEPMLLMPLRHKLQWNFAKQRARGPEKEEEEAYRELEAIAKNRVTRVRVTGPLQTSDGHATLEVREFFAEASYSYSADEKPATEAQYP